MFIGILFLPSVSGADIIGNFNNHFVEKKVDDGQLGCLTKALFWEVRKPVPYEMELVASVIINRSLDKKYPQTVCGVILDKGQFEYVTRGLHNDKKTIDMANTNEKEKQALLIAHDTAKRFLSGAKKPLIKSIAYVSNKIKKPKSTYWDRLKLEEKSNLHSFYVATK